MPEFHEHGYHHLPVNVSGRGVSMDINTSIRGTKRIQELALAAARAPVTALSQVLMHAVLLILSTLSEREGESLRQL